MIYTASRLDLLFIFNVDDNIPPLFFNVVRMIAIFNILSGMNLFHYISNKIHTKFLLQNIYIMFYPFLLQSLLAQTREKQAATLSEVTWRGRTVPVRNEQVRAFLLTCQENEQQVSSEVTDSESKVSVYESLLMQCKDSLQIIREELKADPVSYPQTLLH